MSTGSELEGTTLEFLDEITKQGNAANARQQQVLGAATSRMLSELREIYSKYESKGTGAYQAQQLYARLRNTKDLLPAKEAKALTDAFKGDLAKAYDKGSKTAKEMAEILKATPDTLKKTAKPNLPAIDAAGKRLNDFWAKENTAFRDRVTALTQTALAQGSSYRKLALQVRELLVLERDSGRESDRSARLRQRMGIAGRAELIARTELQTAAVNGKIASFREMGYQWARWSATAERSCPFCISRDGLLYTLDDVEGAIPAHPRCRCSLIPADPPPEFDKRRFEEKGVDAAESLDDAFWARARAEKIRQFQAKNPTVDDAAIRRYVRTPTNSQAYLKPGTAAPAPQWAPSGQLIPNLERTVLNAQRAAERAKQRDSQDAKEKAEQKRLEEEAKKAEAAAKKEAEEKAKAEAERLAREEAELLAETKALKSKEIKRAADQYKYDIEQAVRKFKITPADARAAYKMAAKDTGYTWRKALKNEDLEDDFLIAFRHYKQKAAKQYEAERQKIKDDLAKLKAEAEERAAKAKSKDADIEAAKKPVGGRTKDGLDDKSKFMSGKAVKYPGNDPSKWTKKQLKDVVALLPRQQQLRLNRQIKADKLAEILDDLSYQVGVAVKGNEWARKVNDQLVGSAIRKKLLDEGLRDAFEFVHSPKMSPKQMNEWLSKADGRVGGDVMYGGSGAKGFTKKEMGKYWDDLIKAGGNTAAIKAMTKMMRETDLLIVWGKDSNRKNTKQMLDDVRVQNWQRYSGKTVIPPGGANGWTSSTSQVVGMKHRELSGTTTEFDPSKANMKEWKKVIDDYLQKSVDHYVTSKGKDYEHLKINGKWRENFSTSAILQDAGVNGRGGGNTLTELLANMHMSTLVHELGHQMQWFLDKRGLGQARRYPATQLNAAQLYTKEKKSGTDYSKKNEMERFAEDWVLYTVSPDLFRQLKPKTAKQLDDLIETMFTKDHYGEGPTLDQILANRPELSTKNGESVVSGQSNPTTEDF